MSSRPAALPLLLAFAVLASAPAALAAPVEVLSFDVLRNGKPIGSHVYTIRRDGTAVEVGIRTAIDFRLGFLPLYAFRHESTETWRDGRLETLHSLTDDNGARRELAVVRGAAGLEASLDGRPPTPVGEALPASLWSPATAAGGRFLDTVEGKVMQVQAEQPAPGKVRLDGDLKRKVWYDAEGRLEGVRFKAKDGSEISYRLRPDQPAS